MVTLADRDDVTNIVRHCQHTVEVNVNQEGNLLVWGNFLRTFTLTLDCCLFHSNNANCFVDVIQQEWEQFAVEERS